MPNEKTGPASIQTPHYVVVLTSQPIEGPTGHIEGHVPAIVIAPKAPPDSLAAAGIFHVKAPQVQDARDQIRDGLPGFGLVPNWSLKMQLANAADTAICITTPDGTRRSKRCRSP